MEYARNEKYHFCDDNELCMVVDKVTGKPQRSGGNAIVTLEQALKYVKNYTGWGDRMIIVKFSCIRGFKL